MSCAEILVALDAEITRVRQMLERLEQARAGVAALVPEATSPSPKRQKVTRGARPRQQAVTRTGRRTPIAPGSLHDRIVSTLAEFKAPMRFTALVEEAKARPGDVISARKELVAAKRIVVIGTGRGTRYALPQFANVVVAE